MEEEHVFCSSFTNRQLSKFLFSPPVKHGITRAFFRRLQSECCTAGPKNWAAHCLITAQDDLLSGEKETVYTKPCIDHRQKHQKGFWFITAALFWFIFYFLSLLCSWTSFRYKKKQFPTGCTMGTFNEASCLCYGAGIWLWRVCSGLYTVQIQGTICRDNRLPQNAERGTSKRRIRRQLCSKNKAAVKKTRN